MCSYHGARHGVPFAQGKEKNFIMKTRTISMKTKQRLTRSALLLGMGAMTLTPFAASAQMRGGMGGGMSGGGMSRGSGFGGASYSGGQVSGGQSYSRQSYTPAPSYTPSGSSNYSRPSYTPSASPNYSRPNNYAPSTGTGSSPILNNGSFGSQFGRSAPTGYNYGERGGSNYGIGAQGQGQNQGQAQNRGQYQGQVQGQAQNNRQGNIQSGRAAVPSVPGPGNYPNLRQAPITQMPLPQSRIAATSPRLLNSLVYSRPQSFYNRYGLNGGNAYSNAYDPTNPYRYRYGVPHGNGYYYGGFGSQFFVGGLAYYPYYSPFFSFGYSALSPYAFYYGSFPSFITLGSVYSAPPEYVYVPYPVYQNGSYQGERSDDVDSYYLNRSNRVDDQYRVGENGRSLPAPVPARDAALEATLSDIRDAWKTGKIDPLAKHVRRDAKVAVYLRGKYQYSLDAGDYLDMTRDALSATKTVRFELDAPQRKENGVYTVTGRHIYRDKDGNERTVHVTYVLEKADTDYVLTQVGSAPDKLDEEPASSN